VSTLLGCLGDDNIDAVQMLAMFLEAAGDKVVVERESRRMVKRALTEMSKLYVLGIGIPELDENELAQQLQLHQLTSKANQLTSKAV